MPKISSNTFAFTKQKIENLKTETKDIYYHDSIEKGLTLIVRSTGAKTFWLRYYMHGKEIKMRIGDFKDISIENARKQAVSHKNNMNTGINPKDVVEKIRSEPTFGELCHHYVTRHLNKYKRSIGYEDTDLKRYFHKLYNKRASEITNEMVDNMHAKIKHEGYITKANKTLQVMKTVYNFAIKTNYYTGANPAVGIKMFPESSRTRIMMENEFESFFRSLEEEPSRDAKDFFMIALLTGVRRGNILEMKWKNVNLDSSIPFWIIDKTKNGQSHVAVLIEVLVEILKSRKRLQEENNIISEFVFAGTGKSGHLVDVKKAKARIMKRAEIEGFRTHDLRRTIATYVSDEGANTIVVKDILGHMNSDVTAIYARTKLATKHRILSGAWEEMKKLGKGLGEWW